LPREKREMSGKSLIMAQDEGCFGRISRAKRCWAPAGVRPHAPTQVVREYLYVYAAVAPALGQMVSLILPEASTAMMNRLVQPLTVVDNSIFSPIRLTVPSDLPYDQEAFFVSHFQP
jgi:hypothetical protein